jgi:DDE_Tnp_1-associated
MQQIKPIGDECLYFRPQCGMTYHGVSAMVSKPKSLAYHIATLHDPRKVRGQRHLLLDIMVIAILATMSGVDEWEGIEEFGNDQEARLRTFLDLPNGIPSHDTFGRVFQMLDPRAFSEAFLAWVRGIREKIPGDVVALDGKTLRASMSEGQPALHVVSAWSAQNRIVLGQRAVDEKSNEITAIPELLKILDLKGCIVTISREKEHQDAAAQGGHVTRLPFGRLAWVSSRDAPADGSEASKARLGFTQGQGLICSSHPAGVEPAFGLVMVIALWEAWPEAETATMTVSIWQSSLPRPSPFIGVHPRRFNRCKMPEPWDGDGRRRALQR